MEFVKPINRDLEAARGALQAWLTDRMDAVDGLEVKAVRRFPLGQSGDLLDLDVACDGADGGPRERGLVVRVEPTPDYQLFLDTNFLEQYRVIEALGLDGRTPIPGAVGFEEDRSVIGDRFYVMERVPGQAGDSGLDWVKQLAPGPSDQLWRTGLAAMAALHTADWRALGLDFLDKPGRGGDPLSQELHYYREYYDWVRGGEDREVIDLAFEWLEAGKPPSAPFASIVWGDARPGNQLFTAPDCCSAVVDLEQACLGTAESDLGWWCFIEDQRRRAFGVGCPDLDYTVGIYEELIGRPVRDIKYHIVFACLRIAVLRIKLYLLREGQPDQYGKYEGDRNLAATMLRFVPDRLSAGEAQLLRRHVDA